MPTEERTFWYCGGKTGLGHVVGELGHLDFPSGRVTTLLLYEEALMEPPDLVPPARVSAIVGTVMGIQCSRCHNRFNWYVGLATFQKLMDAVRKDYNNV